MISVSKHFANIPVVGIVGGVSAGKSSVVRNILDLQLCVCDADLMGHELLLTNDIRKKLKSRFGDDIFDHAGFVLRHRWGEKVFGDSPEQTNNRNEILLSIKQAPQDADAIILDAALLLEAGWADECDAVIFIDTPLELRQQRAAADRGWSAEDLQRREASQWSLLKKRQHAQFAVDNSRSVAVAAEQMKFVLGEIIERHGACPT